MSPSPLDRTQLHLLRLGRLPGQYGRMPRLISLPDGAPRWRPHRTMAVAAIHSTSERSSAARPRAAAWAGPSVSMWCSAVPV